MHKDRYLKLVDEVNEHHGLLATQRLREFDGSRRTGKYVNRRIHDQLLGHGLRHFPEGLPMRQQRYVYVFERDTAVSELIDLCLVIPAGRKFLEWAVAYDKPDPRTGKFQSPEKTAEELSKLASVEGPRLLAWFKEMLYYW
jgi:hypothetical protein